MKIAQVTPENLTDISSKVTPIAPGGSTNSILLDSTQFLLVSATRVLMEFAAYLFLVSLLVSGAIYIFSFGSEETLGQARKAILYSFIGFAVFTGSNAALSFYLTRLERLAGKEITLVNVASEVFSTTLIVAAVAFLGVFVYSGLRYFFTGGNEENAANARRGMIYAFIGLLIVASAYAMGRLIIGRIFGF